MSRSTLVTSPLAVIALTAMLLVGCGSGTSETTDTRSPSTSEPSANTPPESEQGGGDTTTVAAAEDPGENPVPTDTTPFIAIPGGQTIEQLTPVRGNTERPVLTWTEVPVAAEYSVVVFDAAGDSWWSWYGPETEVVLGGVAGSAATGGPRAATGTTWAVVAYDIDGTALATSPVRPVE